MLSLASNEDKKMSRKRKPCAHNLSDSSSCDSEKDSNRDLIAQIRKAARDPSCISGPEAYNDMNRDKYVRYQEMKGDIQAHVIANSVTHPVPDEILIWLVGLRNVISHGLPQMDRAYITKVVFDPRHKNLVLIGDGNVIGGICFRMFPQKQFSEIVFIAVFFGTQIHGYGTHMMNHLKDYHIKHDIYTLLTYAAHEAYGYFEKQGFSSRITLPQSAYEGYINAYKGASLMECKLDQSVVYTELSENISLQKKILKRLIDDHEKSKNSPLNHQCDL